jgi:hypothetical protein
VVFQWLDATDGKKVAEVTADLTPVLGPGEGGDNVVSQAYDAATGQIVVGVGADGEAAAKKGGEIFTVYADPKTRKSSVIPFVNPAGVVNGVVVGAKGSNQEGAADGTIVVTDAVTGKVTKQTPTKLDYLKPAGSGTKHAFLSGNSYVGDQLHNNVLYSVDIATGTVGSIKSQAPAERTVSFTCLSDRASAVVCTGGSPQFKSLEIVGFDDTSGKKTWGYTSESASRVVPFVTAAFHGVVYAQTEAQPVLMDAATGNDLPSSSATPSSSTTPADGSSPTEGSTPSGDPSSQGKDPSTANGSDMSLFKGKMASPVAVTPYGGAYLQSGVNTDFQMVLIALAPTA